MDILEDIPQNSLVERMDTSLEEVDTQKPSLCHPDNIALVQNKENHSSAVNICENVSDELSSIPSSKEDVGQEFVDKNSDTTLSNNSHDQQHSEAVKSTHSEPLRIEQTSDLSNICLEIEKPSNNVPIGSSVDSPKDLKKKLRIIDSDNESNDAVLDRIMAVGNTEVDKHSIEETNTNTQKSRIKKRITVMDSDSESEEVGDTNLDDKLNENEEEMSMVSSNSRKLKSSFFDSDESDVDDVPTNKVSNKKDILSDSRPTKSRLRALIDSDSSDCEDSIDQDNLSDKTNESTCYKGSSNNHLEIDVVPVYVTAEKGELVVENPDQNSLQRARLAALCDPDSDEDYPIENTDYCNVDKEDASSKSKNQSKKPKSKADNSKAMNKTNKTFEMTPKEAAQQREEIAAESQRMAREKDVSLPYHKPKVHTLQEFLTRRSKLASVVPITSRGSTSIATAVRMTREQLAVFQKRMDEREKELKEFYKSDSESDQEDPEDTDYIPPGSESILTNDQTNSTEQILDSPYKETVAEKDKPSEETSTEGLDKRIGASEEKETRFEIKGSEDNQDPSDQPLNDVSEDTNDINMETESCPENNEQIDLTKVPENSHSINDNKDDKQTTTSNENLRETEVFSLRLEETESINDADTSDIQKNDTETSNLEEKGCEGTESLNYHTKTDICNAEEDILKSNQIPSNLVENNSEDCETDSHQHNTMSYDFNLDDIEDNSDLSKSNNEINENDMSGRKMDESSKRKFEYTELDAEIENFAVNKTKINILSDVVISSKQNENQECSNAVPKSRLQLLREKLANSTPKLSGGPNDFIILEDKEKSAAVTKLMERFAKHASAKKHNSAHHKVSLNVVTVESCGDIHQETVAINVDDDDTDVHAIEEKPGVKLSKLRKELQNQMEREKSERWEKKASEGIKPSTTEAETKEGYEDDLPDEYDDEEEEILTDEDELDDEELEEDDIELKDKPIKKSEFLDGEAEESEIDDQDAESNVEENENDEEEGEEDASDNEVQDVNDTSNMTCGSESKNASDDDELPDLTESSKNRPLKRIVKAFEDSDDSDCDNEQELEKTLTEENVENQGTDHTIASKSSNIEDEEDFSVYQRQSDKTPIRQMTQPKSIEFNTPISFITGLENLRSASKSLKGSPAQIVSPFQMPQDSPLKPSFSSVSQKKLFNESDVDSQESSDIPETQPTSDVEAIYSMNLADTLPKEDTPCTQDILDICSGGFTGVTQIDPTDKSAICKDFMVLDTQNQTQEVKSLGEDLIISQLLDEEELENFKKKFESPINRPSTESITQKLQEAEEISGGGRILDSDDEDETASNDIIKRKRNRKIAFSDDESSDDEQEEFDHEDEIDLHDNEGIEDEEIDNIGYDSEENEIDLNQPKKDKMKIQDFMENEAELSESEWGSEDEDENDLDKLEFEAGDTEKFDEDQMKEDLEKIHMRRLLDDDTRQVKLLQELLLEDGEMHGTGRQRQFRWKNIDDADDADGDAKRTEDEDYIEDEESEEQWRRRRHEREMFLKEKASQSEDVEQDVLLGKSKLLTIGQKILQKSQCSNGSQSVATPPEKPVEKTESPLLHKFTLLNKRGSFLSRGEEALQKVAYFTKECSINLNGPKTSKNFVFQAVSSKSVTAMQAKKRKAADGTPDVLKKLRLSNNFSPAAESKKKKPERKKRLF